MKRILLALTIATLAFGGIAAAQFGFGGRGVGLGWCWLAPDLIKQQLGLTDEQVKKLTELRTKHLEKVGKLVAELAAKRTELQTLWLSPKPDEQRVKELTEQIAKLQAELVTERTNFQLEVRKILTTEQLSKLPQIGGRSLGLGLGLGPRWGRSFGWRRFAPPAPIPPAPRRGWSGWGRRWGW